jgi:molybdate transport system substrate-binding protein
MCSCQPIASGPKQLESEGLGVAGSRITYAIGTLVLWSPQPDVVDAGGNILQQWAYSHAG